MTAILSCPTKIQEVKRENINMLINKYEKESVDLAKKNNFFLAVSKSPIVVAGAKDHVTKQATVLTERTSVLTEMPTTLP